MSLRAVARKLEVSPSYWSKVLRGEKPLTKNLFPKAVKTLGLDSQQVAVLQQMMLREIAPAKGIEIPIEHAPSEAYVSLGESDFWLLEKWFYIPVLNSFTLSTSHKSSVIAKRLGLPLTEVESTIELLRLRGFLHKQNGEWVRSERLARFPTQKSHASVRRYHQQMAQKAREELGRAGAEEGFSSRHISSICFAGSPEKIAEARQILEDALYRATNLMANDPRPSEIFQLNVQLFPLTR